MTNEQLAIFLGLIEQDLLDALAATKEGKATLDEAEKYVQSRMAEMRSTLIGQDAIPPRRDRRTL